MFYFHLNLALLIVAFFLIALYFFMRMYFTYQYKNSITLKIESNNDVISNHEIEDVVKKIQEKFKLKDWTVNYGDLKYKNFGRGISFKKKTISIDRLPMTSVGYELDYVISRLWYVKQIKNKHYIVRLFSFISNWWMKLVPYLCILLFVVQAIIFFYGVGNNDGQDISNAGMKWLFDFPLFFILVFVFLLSIGVGFSSLQAMKQHMENEYTKDTLHIFKDDIKNFLFDFKSARTYSQRISIGYNFALIKKDKERLIHWVSPFLNY